MQSYMQTRQTDKIKSSLWWSILKIISLKTKQNDCHQHFAFVWPDLSLLKMCLLRFLLIIVLMVTVVSRSHMQRLCDLIHWPESVLDGLRWRPVCGGLLGDERWDEIDRRWARKVFSGHRRLKRKRQRTYSWTLAITRLNERALWLCTLCEQVGESSWWDAWISRQESRSEVSGCLGDVLLWLILVVC